MIHNNNAGDKPDVAGVLARILEDGPRHMGDTMVLMAIALHDRGNAICPSLARLQHLARLSRRSVQDSLRRLQSEGWIEVTRSAGGRSTSRYRVCRPRPSDEQAGAEIVAFASRRGAAGAPPAVQQVHPKPSGVQDVHRSGAAGAPPAVQDVHLKPSGVQDVHLKAFRGAAGAPGIEGSKEPSPIGRARAKRSTRIPDGWKVSDSGWEFAAKKGLTGPEIEAEAGKFEDHHRARGSAFFDWEAAWKSWVRKSVEFREERRAKHGQGDPVGEALGRHSRNAGGRVTPRDPFA